MKKVITIIISFVLIFTLHSNSLADTSRSNPLHLYDIVFFSINDSSQSDDSVQLVIRKVVYGTEAEDIVNNANFFNALPEDGKEYCLAYFHVEMQSQDEDKQFSISKEDFTIVSKTGKIYDALSHSVSGLEDSATIFSGGSADFVVPMYIDKNDIPLLLYNDSLWFSVDDKEGTREKRINDKSQFIHQIPDDTISINDLLYIGMSIDDLKEYVKTTYGISPIDEISSQGLLAIRYENVMCDLFGYKSDMYVIASEEDKSVKLINFIHPGFSKLASYSALNDYDKFKLSINKIIGIDGEEKEQWDNKNSKKLFKKNEGAALGKYSVITEWISNGLVISLGMNAFGQENLFSSEAPCISVFYCDQEFVKYMSSVIGK